MALERVYEPITKPLRDLTAKNSLPQQQQSKTKPEEPIIKKSQCSPTRSIFAIPSTSTLKSKLPKRKASPAASHRTSLPTKSVLSTADTTTTSEDDDDNSEVGGDAEDKTISKKRKDSVEEASAGVLQKGYATRSTTTFPGRNTTPTLKPNQGRYRKSREQKGTKKSGGNMVNSKKRFSAVKLYRSGFKKEYIYWNHPSELIDRLRLLYSSKSAGHKGHDNEILSIIEELYESGIIY